MRILYIIGNGFDLNLGLKTDYPSFYKYYLKQTTTNPFLLKLKEQISKEQYTTWSDLELGLGKYAEKCTKEEYLQIMDDIRTNLTTYLKEETNKVHFGLSDSFYEDIKKPERHLERMILDKYYAYRDKYSSGLSTLDINVVSFNYTYTFERIFGIISLDGDSIVNIRANDNRKPVNQVIHIHGTLENELNLGVNDASQIFNDSFKSDMDILEYVVKPEFNDACLNGKNGICENLIKNADVIVLFGVSMGITDTKWWSLIGEQLKKRRCMIVYYPFDEKKDDIKHPNSKRRWTDNYSMFLKEKFGILDVKDDSLLGVILVSINKPIFKTPIIRNIKEEDLRGVIGDNPIISNVKSL